MDINQYYIKNNNANRSVLKKISYTTDIEKIVEKIKIGFNVGLNDYFVMNTIALSLGDFSNKEELKNRFSQFKESHLLTKESISRINKEGVGIVYFAAKEGDANTITKLAKLKANLDQSTSDGATPAFLAAQAGHANVIAELAKEGVNLNQSFNNGATLIFMAAQQNHIHVIKKIRELCPEINMNSPFFSSAESLRKFSIEHGSQVMNKMNELIDRQLNKGEDETHISLLPYDIAQVMGNTETMELILSYESCQYLKNSKNNNAVTKFRETEKQRGFEGSLFESQEHKIEQKYIREAADRFDYWMTTYNHLHIHKENNNIALVVWLNHDNGGKYVKDYKQFCKLALALHEKGYDTNPPPSRSEFNKALERYESSLKNEGKSYRK